MAVQSSIKIRLKSFDYKQLEESVSVIVETAKRTGAVVIGPIPMPTRRERFMLLTSPHIDATNGREQFEIRTHIRLVVIRATEKTVDSLMRLDLAAGVDVQLSLE